MEKMNCLKIVIDGFDGFEEKIKEQIKNIDMEIKIKYFELPLAFHLTHCEFENEKGYFKADAVYCDHIKSDDEIYHNGLDKIVKEIADECKKYVDSKEDKEVVNKDELFLGFLKENKNVTYNQVEKAFDIYVSLMLKAAKDSSDFLDDLEKVATILKEINERM